MNLPRVFRWCVLLGLAWSPVASTASAQSLWLPRDKPVAIMFEMARPNVEGRDTDLFSGAFYLTGRVKVASTFAVVAEIPYARHESKSDYWYNPDFSAMGVGNVYLGVEVGPASGPFSVDLGFRPPIADDDEYPAHNIASLQDASRWPAFLNRHTSVQAALNVADVAPSGWGFRLRFGPLATFAENGSSDTELFAMHAMEVGYYGRSVRVGAGFGGSFLLTGDYGNLGEYADNDWNLHADFLRGPVRPGLTLRVPVGARAEVIPVVLGASVTWAP